MMEDEHLEADYEDRQNGGIPVDEDEPLERPRRQRLRGDNIPSISDYSHWNEEAESMWYAENKYDMEHWDEPIDDDEDW